MRANRGFTLLEVMIAVAIVGILAAIAYPSYTASVQRGWRADGKAALMLMAQAQERHYTAFNTYSFNGASSLADRPETGAVIAKAFSGDSESSAKYTIEVTACGAGAITSCFVATARPRGWTDTLCGQLTYDSVSGRSQTAGSAAQCWER